jgi:hypothetical protein
MKVRLLVIGRVAIDVMDLFFRRKKPAESFFDDESMFRYVTAFVPVRMSPHQNVNITALAPATTPFPAVVLITSR